MSKIVVIIISFLLIFLHTEIVEAKAFSPTKIKLPHHANIQIKELVAEINQNLAYFCMKKSSRFKKETHCFKHTEMIAINCKGKHKKISSKFLACVLNKLTRR